MSDKTDVTRDNAALRFEMIIRVGNGVEYRKFVLFRDDDPGVMRDGFDVAESTARYVFWAMKNEGLDDLMRRHPEDFYLTAEAK